MEKKEALQNQSEIQKALLQEEVQTRRAEEKTLNKLDKLLEQDIDRNLRVAEDRRTVDREQLRQDIRSLRDFVHATSKAEPSPVADNSKTILSQAIQETEHMVKLSDEAKLLRHQNYTRSTDDIAQLSKKDPVETTKSKSFVEHFAATSEAIAEDARYNLRAIRIAEDMAIKNQMPQKWDEQGQSELNSQQTKRAEQKDEDQLDLSMSMDYSNSNRESKGKAFAQERQKNATHHQQQHSATLRKSPESVPSHQPVNKLRAKFRRSNLHF